MKLIKAPMNCKVSLVGFDGTQLQEKDGSPAFLAWTQFLYGLLNSAEMTKGLAVYEMIERVQRVSTAIKSSGDNPGAELMLEDDDHARMVRALHSQVWEPRIAASLHPYMVALEKDAETVEVKLCP